jgi:hypothetical protein
MAVSLSPCRLARTLEGTVNTAAASPASWTPVGRRHVARAAVPRKQAAPKDVARQADRFFDLAFDLAKEHFGDLWDELTESGRQSFVHELVNARFDVDRTDAIQDVIDSWYRTLELRTGAGYGEALADAGKSPIELEESVHTIEELRGILKR